MKITFLGTSHGVPLPDRHCTSIMLEVGNNIYLFDAGAPVFDRMFALGKDVNNLKAVFLSHGHADHVQGLQPLMTVSLWYYKTASYDIFAPEMKTLELMEESIRFSESGIEFEHDRLRFHLAKSGAAYNDGVITVEYIANKHLAAFNRPSYSLLIKAEGKTVLFTADMSNGLAANDFPVIALSEKCDLVICELAHFGLEQMERILPNLKTDKLCFTHVFPQVKHEQIADLIKNNPYPYAVLDASDNDEIVL